MKSRSHFQFRQFSVSDDRCSMKVGTDAVLLASWADLSNAKRVLDIGTGSGVIALIAAQRTMADCHVDGIEIQEDDCAQAVSNAAASPWSDRVHILCTAVQDYHPRYRYDIILCNPPYFINSLRPPGEGRTTARHAVQLDHATLISSVDRLLSPLGKASFIMPPEEGKQFESLITPAGMQATRICSFRTRAGKRVERVLMTFARLEQASVDQATGDSDLELPMSLEVSEILLYDEDNRWSREYTELTQDLYLPRP
jgi:tRNA1Val (adenine37-N6)-methyltransferase